MEEAVASPVKPKAHIEVTLPSKTDTKSSSDMSGEKIVENTAGVLARKWADTLVRRVAGGQELNTDDQTGLHEATTSLHRTLTSLTPDTAVPSLEMSHEQSDPTFANLPASADSFTLYHAATGRVRDIPPFNDQLTQQISEMVSMELARFDRDHNPAHLQKIMGYIGFSSDARALYTTFSTGHKEDIHRMSESLTFLGLTKNLVTQGEDSAFITALVKSAQFGHLTTEDLGRQDKTTPKNTLRTGQEPGVTSITGNDGMDQTSPKYQELFALVKNVTTDKQLADLREQHLEDPQMLKLIEWTARQAIVRELLPKEAQVPVRRIDMSTLEKVKDLGNGEDENFQASNPVSLWKDPESGRRFIVKQCPEQTLQSDYFGLEMLQLAGVPIYEFYFGEVPGKDGKPPDRVLVAGWLEGFQEPSKLISLPEGSPKDMMKARLPDELVDNPYIKRGMLVELLIGEYNTKAHNLMVLGKSVQHLDQGACLTSTASGKFKGFGEQVTINDVRDVLHAFTDWDWQQEESVNQAYEKVAVVNEGKLVINDVSTAERLLHQLKSIPQEKINEALVQAGFVDGPASIGRMQRWMGDIDNKILPSFDPATGTDSKKTTDSPRRDQYIRWANDAKATFTKAIAMGGELSYYKHALATRRESLTKLWEQAIAEAKNK